MFGLADGWLWAIGGALLLITEMIAPGFFLIFIGAAAIATGLISIALGLGLPAQLMMFVVFAGGAVLLGRHRYNEQPNDDTDSTLNDPSRRLDGRTAIAVTTIDAHGGRVRLADGEWSARGGPAAIGESVRIVGVDGNCLIVDRAV